MPQAWFVAHCTTAC